MIDTALNWVKDYGPASAAFVIAASSIYTAWILRRQNRSTGWLEVVGWRVMRVNGGLQLYSGDPVPENRKGQPEIQVQIINTGYRLEQVLEVCYRVKGHGWLFGPQRSDTIYLFDPYPEPIETAPAKHRVFATPFEIGPQQLRRWECTVGHAQLPLITCAKMTTAKGEKMHARFTDARDRSSRTRRYWRNACCRVGMHL